MDYSILIKKLREELLMTQEEFAKYIGASFQSVNRWENGKCEPTMKMKRKLRELQIASNIKLEGK